jgi:regulator of PEP synthase PpsR (kinase-PPPase family)
MLARNAVAQLEGVEVERRLWKMVRRLDQVPEILGALASSPGYVLHSISHSDVRAALEEGCRRLSCLASLPSNR